MKSVPTECPKTCKRIIKNFITYLLRRACLTKDIVHLLVLLDYSTDLALLSHQTLGTNFGNWQILMKVSAHLFTVGDSYWAVEVQKHLRGCS